MDRRPPADQQPPPVAAVESDQTIAMLRRRLALREQELSALFDAVPGIMYRCRLNADWTMDRMSVDCEPLLGYPASDFIGNAVRCFASVIHPGDRLRVSTEIRAAVGWGERYDIE